MFNQFFSSEKPLLVAVASGGEAGVVLRAVGADEKAIKNDWHIAQFHNFSVLQTGVGKANAAGAVAQELMHAFQSGKRYFAVLSIGIAGSLHNEVAIGSVVLGSESAFADEGVPHVNGRDWTTLEEAGWAETSFASPTTEWFQELKPLANYYGPIATVSTISGTDAIAQEYARRCNAIAEGMEGAAIAQVCSRFATPFAEIRVISNRCGNRDVNKLDIPTSFKRLAQLVAELGLTAGAAQPS